ncbi:hypothetical protein EPUL_000026 [Erysiphe pulchra]|uniref:MYND-type zinc finger protein samB n=1 Tax=Erysiphe pulchra TaxID=225359 RepID=A0A2S4Q2E6_9PEZI|nr:hypothetical protein EPUL_000026 [Erysiphe pulchra]
MREVNFSIPNVNKASVGITTALYDRRALDCTSTLPLINSLNHLAYLTTSSARIRDILTIDGGVERLVCLLKAGRSKDPMDMWKWNLAFQCVVNVGVRGSENVRTRVVEADLIPVIATILDNYIKVFDRYREKAEEALQAKEQRSNGSRSVENQISNKDTSFEDRTVGSHLESRGIRRHLPPSSLELPSASTNFLTTGSDSMEITPTSQQTTTSSPSERSGFLSNRHYYRIQDTRPHALSPSRHNIQPIIAAVPSMDAADGFSIRPVRDIDRLPSMVVRLHNHISQPESPTTPLPSNLVHSTNMRSTSTTTQIERSSRRPTIRHQTSIGASEDPSNDSILSDESGVAEISGDITTAIQSPVNVDIQEIGMDEDDSMLSAVESRLGLNQNTASDTQDVGAFNHRFTLNGSAAENNALQNGPNLGFLPVGQTAINIPPPIHFSNLSRFPMDRTNQFHALTAMPRDEDILMSLQLLAYVSKYCNLRPYFQKSHLVPKLKIGAELKLLDMDEAAQFSGYSMANITTSNMSCSSNEECEEEEYLLPDDFNIFPLVEKFTIRHHPQDMQYWAGVVMRNLCRKDDSRGDNLPSVEDVEELSIAARNAKRARGFFTDTGA